MSRDEKLHRIRVKTKQWRARIKLFKNHSISFSAETKALRKLSADLCAYRDYQVLLKILRKQVCLHRKSKHSDEWRELLRLLQKERGVRLRATSITRAMKAMNSLEGKILRKLSLMIQRNNKAKKPLREPLITELRVAGRRLRQQAALCQKSHENIDFHTLRKRCKDIEYQLEWLYPQPPRDIQVMIRKLHQVNSDLGKGNDWAGIKALAELYGMRHSVFAAKRVIELRRNRALKLLKCAYFPL